MTAPVKMNKQGLRDLNYYGPKNRKTELPEPAPVVEDGAPPEPKVEPGRVDPVVSTETPAP